MDLRRIKEEMIEASLNYQRAQNNLQRAQELLELAVEAGVDAEGFLTETASGARALIDRMSVVYNEKTNGLSREIGWLLEYARGTFER